MTDNPQVLILENAPLQIRIYSYVLEQFGIKSTFVSEPEELVSVYSELNPQICVVNIDHYGEQVIRSLRTALGENAVLIAVSISPSDDLVIRAIENGANDYIVKPLDRRILAAKFSRFVQTPELMMDFDQALVPVPKGGFPAKAEFRLNVEEISETGVRLSGKCLLAKGTVFLLDHPIVQDITGTRDPILLTVRKTWVESEKYNSFAEFSGTNEKLLTQVRKWLASQPLR